MGKKKILFLKIAKRKTYWRIAESKQIFSNDHFKNILSNRSVEANFIQRINWGRGTNLFIGKCTNFVSIVISEISSKALKNKYFLKTFQIRQRVVEKTHIQHWGNNNILSKPASLIFQKICKTDTFLFLRQYYKQQLILKFCNLVLLLS